MTAKQRLQIRTLRNSEAAWESSPPSRAMPTATGEATEVQNAYQGAWQPRGAFPGGRDFGRRGELRPATPRSGRPTGKGAELRSPLSRRVQLGDYLASGQRGPGHRGRGRGEYNAALSRSVEIRFPLRLLAPAAPEVRATTDADGEASQGRWLDRLFATSAARYHAGITMESRAAPALKALSHRDRRSHAREQQARSETTAAAAWTVSSVEAKPKRNSARVIISMEDDLRLPGLESGPPARPGHGGFRCR